MEMSSNVQEHLTTPSQNDVVGLPPVSSSIKTNIYDGKTAWSVYKTQFDIIAEANNWDERAKASQLAASLRGPAAEILQTLPANERMNFTSLVNALELRYGERNLKEACRIQLRSRRQKPGESLQELASEIERLSHLSFADCPAEVRESLAVQYFTDAIRDPDVQQAVIMGECKNINSALALASKFEVARQASRNVRPVRGAAVSDTSPSYQDILNMLKELLSQSRRSERQTPRKQIVCWTCGVTGHLRSNCPSKTEQIIRQIHSDERSKPVIDIWSDEEVRKAQEEDPDIGPILILKEKSNAKPEWQEISPYSPTTKHYWALWDSLVFQNGVLYRKWENDDGKSFRMQLLLPRSRVPDVLKEIHNSATGGHFGIMKTLSKVRERFFWNNARTDVERWCRECTECMARKGPKKKTRGTLKRYNVGAPFERIALDVLGPLPRTLDGNKYILVVMDYFTKWPEAYAIPDQEAKTVCDVLTRNWICRYGVPLLIHSDQGTNFCSSLFQELCKTLGMEKTRTTPLHPQSDGMVERLNRTILNHLSIFVSKKQEDWDQHLPLFLLAYRSAVHESTRFSPSRMLFGRDLRLPCDLLFGRPSDAPSSPEQYVQDLQARLREVHHFARERINIASDRMKTRYDSNANERIFKDGDKVWFFNPRRRRGLCPKLQQNWEGPYLVVKKLNSLIYRIQKSPSSKPRVVHVDRLAPFTDSQDTARDVQLLRGGQCNVRSTRKLVLQS